MDTMLAREIDTITDDQFTLSDAAVAAVVARMDTADARTGEGAGAPRPHLWTRLRSGLSHVAGRVRRRGWSPSDERPIDRAWGSANVAATRSRQSVTSF